MLKNILFLLAITSSLFSQSLDCFIENDKIKAVFTLDYRETEKKITFDWSSPNGLYDNRSRDIMASASSYKIWDYRFKNGRTGTHIVKIYVDDVLTSNFCEITVK